jgi:hypothetical protein
MALAAMCGPSLPGATLKSLESAEVRAVSPISPPKGTADQINQVSFKSLTLVCKGGSSFAVLYPILGVSSLRIQEIRLSMIVESDGHSDGVVGITMQQANRLARELVEDAITSAGGAPNRSQSVLDGITLQREVLMGGRKAICISLPFDSNNDDDMAIALVVLALLRGGHHFLKIGRAHV